MGLVEKTLWHIESRLRESHFGEGRGGETISLEDIAAAGRVSRFHLSRAFGLATGWSVMRYVRARRLTEAARALASGAPDILGVALDAGYGSHEAFTRAFRDQFGVTPESVRLRGGLDHLELVEPIIMTESTKVELEEPRRETGGALLIAGLSERYTVETTAGIPAQWQRFHAYESAIARRVGDMAYGVCREPDESGHFDYVCGVAVSGLDDLPPELSTVRIAPCEYLVFRHRGHVSGIGGTWRAIMDRWLPDSGMRMADAPTFERYTRDFDPDTGEGGVEIWIPLRIE